MFRAGKMHYEMAERTRGFAYGGLGAMHLLARHIGLIRAIDQQLHLLKRHLPYYESDHVLNLAYNILCHGDFCRRFREAHVLTLMEIINQVRPGVWKQQPETFFRQAILEADGTIPETTGECKEGMDISYKGLCSPTAYIP